LDLPKTTAFVSGANRGLGKHLADQLTSRGAGVQYGDARAYLTRRTRRRRRPQPVPGNSVPGYGGSTRRTNSLTRAIADA
jgi:NAD(P)-dependent dehydrogenase (short-subunit alcohol dehydrogenase family)